MARLGYQELRTSLGWVTGGTCPPPFLSWVLPAVPAPPWAWALPGPLVPALPRRLHLRQEEPHPLELRTVDLLQGGPDKASRPGSWVSLWPPSREAGAGGLPSETVASAIGCVLSVFPLPSEYQPFFTPRLREDRAGHIAVPGAAGGWAGRSSGEESGETALHITARRRKQDAASWFSAAAAPHA